jgi:hypothetical protein
VQPTNSLAPQMLQHKKTLAEEQLQAVVTGRVASVNVELEARDVVSASGRAPRFDGFAGCIQAQLEWLPLQWTYLAKKGAPHVP